MIKMLLVVVVDDDEAGRICVYSDSSSSDLFQKLVLFVYCFSFTLDAISVRMSELQQFIVDTW